jgi:hypothetical protein
MLLIQVVFLLTDISGQLYAATSLDTSNIAPITPAPTPNCGPSWGNVYPPQPTDNGTFFSISATAWNDIWAVGVYNHDSTHDLTLIEHWNGSQWSIIPSPNVGITGSYAINGLLGVAALSPGDVWAVGEYTFSNDGASEGSSEGSSGEGSLIEHWDGTEWSIVENPYTGTLRSISAVSANDIWAVGEYHPPVPGYKTFTLHWDGSAWSHVPSPNPNPQSHNVFRAVEAVAIDDVWAAGYYLSSAFPGGATLIEHWNGSEWSFVPSPNTSGGSVLYDIEAVSANDIWAVGGGAQYGVGGTLTLHWDGQVWSVVPSLQLGPGSGIFYGVTALATGDVWAVGRFRNEVTGANESLIAHWDGSRWSRVESQDPTNENFLYSVTGAPPNDVWAVGYYYPGSFVATLLAKHYARIFTDVPPEHTFYENIRCLACRGIISGYSDGTFRPGNDITRGQIAKMVSNAAGFVEPVDGQSFEDVPFGSPFYVFIERLYGRGHMGGYQCGLRESEPCVPPANRPYFRPNESATRGQISKIVSNAAGFAEPVSGQFYADVTADNPFYSEIMRLTVRGVMSGYPCGTVAHEPCDGEQRPYFRWGNTVTRGQASKIVANTFFPNCVTP